MPCSTQTEARSSPTGSSRQLTAFREVVHEWWNILATIAQRWNADDEGAQPEIQVFANVPASTAPRRSRFVAATTRAFT
jgi:hypothetical protein